jgi:hypothetical protein
MANFPKTWVHNVVQKDCMVIVVYLFGVKIVLYFNLEEILLCLSAQLLLFAVF